MKKMKRILMALAIVTMLLPIAQQTRADADVSIDFFYDNLNDGDWMEVADYGYCWQPSIAVSNSDWRPYSDGYWAYTDVGWTWVSNEDFGWATCHYGRWVRLEDRGWVWVPGYEWGPAWVSWRTGGDYVGWAPLPPTRERVYEGRAITGHVDVEFDIGPLYYNFIDVRYIGEPVLRERIVPTSQNITVINNTVNVTNITYSNSVVYNYGPDYNVISRYSVQPIRRLTIQRETNANFAAGVTSQGITKVEGQNLVIAAPQKIQRGTKTVAPKNVKAKVAAAKVERGWSGVSDPQVKNQLVQKMKAEDSKNVPPPSVSPNQQATGGASPATAAPPTPATGASPATAGATATPVTRMPAASATPARPTPAATATMTPQKGKQKGNRATPMPTPSANGATGEEGQATPAESGRGRHGKAAMPPTITPSPEGDATETGADQDQRRGRGKAGRGRPIEEQGATPKATPNAQEHNAAAGLAPEEQATGSGRGHSDAGARPQQNELAPTGQSPEPQMHQHRGNLPHVQGQPPTREGAQERGHKKKGGEESPTPKPQ